MPRERLLTIWESTSLLCAVGGSMGGMQVLQWVVSYPERIRLAIPIATTSKLSSQAIAFNEVGRQAISRTPTGRKGSITAIPSPGAAWPSRA